MKQYDSQEAALEDALRLACGMTYKFAVPGLERGGGKAVISIPEHLDPESRPDLLRRYGELIHQLGGVFYTGPDVGTCTEDMDIIAETGAPYIFACSPEAGGAGSTGPLTALGVFTGIQVACETIAQEDSLEGCRVLVQGVGSVGGILAEHLHSAGAEVSFSEVKDELIEYYRDELGFSYVADEEVYQTDCDVFAPCALGGILNEVTIPQLKCRIIAGGANNQLAHPEDADRLRARGIAYAPDYVVNVGGAMGITGMELQGWSQEEAEERISASVRRALGRIFEMAEVQQITTDEAAKLIADEHLALISD
jgi:leucine dehydrogenase